MKQQYIFINKGAYKTKPNNTYQFNREITYLMLFDKIIYYIFGSTLDFMTDFDNPMGLTPFALRIFPLPILLIYHLNNLRTVINIFS